MAKQAQDLFLRINEAICYWLGFQVQIGRSSLIHEASLRYPIADAITSGPIGINQIQLEFLHPHFLRKRLDIVVLQDQSDNQLEMAFELKLAKATTSRPYQDEHQRVFNDIMRLAL